MVRHLPAGDAADDGCGVLHELLKGGGVVVNQEALRAAIEAAKAWPEDEPCSSKWIAGVSNRSFNAKRRIKKFIEGG